MTGFKGKASGWNAGQGQQARKVKVKDRQKTVGGNEGESALHTATWMASAWLWEARRARRVVKNLQTVAVILPTE